MTRKFTTLTLFLIVVVFGTLVFAQDQPVPIVTPVVVDSDVFNGVYTGGQTQFFCEPTTGNLIAAWYRYYSSGPDPRRITAAVSTDNGATWTIHENINLGVGAEMNARYATVWGTSMTPIVGYGDRNPGGENRDTRPVVAYDIGGWGGGAFINLFVDDMGTADTVLYTRYVSVSTAPDNENLWALGGYHSADPAEALYLYISEDAGITWSRPKVVASIAATDVGKPFYVYDLSLTGIGITLGYNNTAMFAGICQWLSDDDDIWRILYSTSSDGGKNWDPVGVIPGAEAISFGNADNYNQYAPPLVDQAGNWHIFGIGADSTEYAFSEVTFPEPYRGYDFRFDGTSWTINKFVFPGFLENGIAARGDYPADEEEDIINCPGIGPDGTLYFAYSDVVDTTGANGDETLFNYNIMVMFSEDNGDNWKGPVSVVNNWRGNAPSSMARFATDKLHFVFRVDNIGSTDEFWYIGVPTDTIKARATKVDRSVEKIMPKDFALHQNFPNPFNPTTNITFDLKETGHVTLKIFNERGQEVAKLLDEKMNAGFKGITWHANNLPSGVYFYQLTAENFSETKKMILTK